MALSFAHGAITWTSTDAVNTTYAVSGLSFQPKALMFVVNGQSSGVDAATETADGRVGIGFASGTADRRCVAITDTDAAATMDCGTVHRSDAVVATVTNAGVSGGQLDLSAIASDGFTAIVDVQPPVSLTVFWFAWGGSDITNVETVDIVEPAATGTVDYGTFEPTAVLFAGSQATTANTGRAESAGIMFGAGTGSSNQFVFTTNQDDGSTTADTDRYGRSDECLALIVLAGGNPDVRAGYQGTVAANTFRLNWTARTTGVRRFIAMAIKGGQWRAATGTVNASPFSLTGSAFQPSGGLVASCGSTAESASATSAAQGILCVGGFNGTADERSMGYFTEDATASSNAEVNLSVDYDKVFTAPNTAGGVGLTLDVTALTSDGFTVTRSAATDAFIGYLIFADAVGASVAQEMAAFYQALSGAMIGQMWD